MRLRIIGCTGSMSGPDSPASCYLLQARGLDERTGAERTWNIVLDMGPGSFGQLWQYIEPTTIDAVIFSHCHADHMGDVISLHVYRRWGPGACCDPMILAGPSCLPARVRQIDGAGEEEDYSTEFIFKELSDTETWTLGPFTVSAAHAWHSVPTFGVRIEGHTGFEESRTDTATSTFFYTGDTDLCDSIVDGARGVDLLLSEAGFTEDDTVEGIHMDGRRAGTLAARAEVGRVILTHIQPWNNPEATRRHAEQIFGGRVDLAQTGMSIDF